MGPGVAWWLRHCATSRTVPGLISGGVTGFFSDVFPSDHTMALGSTHPLVNMSTRNILGVKAAGAWDWQPHHLHVPNVMEIWEPKPPGTLWDTPGLLQESCTFYIVILHRIIAHSWPSLSPNVPVSLSLISATMSDPEPVEFCVTISLTVTLTLLYCHMIAFQMFPYTEICTVESQCSGTWPFMITHLNTSCDWFGQIGMGPHGWWLTFPTLFILGRSLSAQSGCAFHEVRYIAVMLRWMGFLSNNLAYFILPNGAFYSSWRYVVCFCSFVYFCYLCFLSSSNQIGILHCKWILTVMVLAAPINHEHWGCSLAIFETVMFVLYVVSQTIFLKLHQLLSSVEAVLWTK